MGVHDEHRKRLRKRFLENGLDSFDEHQALELLLFYAVPQKDTNVLAHKLINEFGSLAEVLDAPFDKLINVSGVGEVVASLLKLQPQMARRYAVSRAGTTRVIASPVDAGRYMLPRFIGERDEIVYAAMLDSRCRLIAGKALFRGSVNSANINVRKIVETVLSFNATGVILAHNHTNGVALPSREDETATVRIRDALRAVDVELVDHLVIADGDFVSFADNGFFK